jgi:hypothetical protein
MQNSASLPNMDKGKAAGWDIPHVPASTAGKTFIYASEKKLAREVPRLDCWYLVTGRGIARIVQTVSSMIAFGLIVSVNALFTPTYIAEMVQISTFLVSFVLLVVYSFNIVRATTSVRWIFHELIYTGIGTYMSFLTTLIAIYTAVRWRHTPWILATIFCVFTQIAFFIDFITLFCYHVK